MGVNDPLTGAKAALDGSSAIVGPSINQGYYTYLYPYGGIIVTPPKGFRWGDAPSYLSIENLEIRNFNMRNTMTAPNGSVKNWDVFCCGIYCERVRHLVVKDCSIHDNGNGFYCNSKYGAAAVSRDILIDHNAFNFNGNPGSYGTHQLYTECDGIVIQNNEFGQYAAGSHGCAIKDRSAGTVIRYNSIVASDGGVAVELLGPQGGSGYIETLPNFRTTYMYGNVLHNPPADSSAHNPPSGNEAFVMYGCDGPYAQSRRGTLYFYQNTVIQKADGTGPRRSPGAFMFWLPNMNDSGGLPIDERVDCRNNVFYCQSETPGSTPADMFMLYTGGAAHIDFGKNWVSPTVKPLLIARGGPFPVPVMTGAQNLIIDPKNAPGLTDPTASYGLSNVSGFVAHCDPALLLAIIDPNILVASIDPNWLVPAVDVAKLIKTVDPNLLVPAVDVAKLANLIDPRQLQAPIDWVKIFNTTDPAIIRQVLIPSVLTRVLIPAVLVGVIDPNLLVGILDPNVLVGIIDPNLRGGLLDPYARPTSASGLCGAGGALSTALPSDMLPTFERFGFGPLRSRRLQSPALGALEPVR